MAKPARALHPIDEKPAPAKKGARITERVTDAAVKEATGRDWKGWMRTLDGAGGAKLQRVRMTWQPDVEAREAMRGHWATVLGGLAKAG